ncbi:MAG TPA: NAD(P)/FAD-dependent oxidoreductase [Pseudonocardia sp.]|jgi:2-polyprenyl-6-methoxyphenol hydroxylase-like FAD-dependent oxidoreductase|uniref:FAD-dependent oxidoreductase n=1 Tax=Pseudonocardia sp. TaxID=60912 RepID=UPI002B4B4201|nr:NAD(P)/FAD-dependent oxidoreductase [Pseudonocardia sp.]HLU59213.1 NAD(P)/FAD-dependent oxidoreductase [Pseudonocardia sp.]
MRTALVIGAGIAGPVAAIALQRAGIATTVCEARADAADEAGAFLTLQVNGIDALRTLGIGHVVEGIGFPTPSMRFRSGTGKLLGEVSTGAPLPDGTVGVTLRRSDLYRALRDEAERQGVTIEHGRRLVDARRVADGVRAEFADGTTVTADLLVGADGVRSRVRQVIDPDAPPARFVPVLNMGGFAPAMDVGAAPGTYEMVFGKRAFFGYVVAPGGSVWWFANPPQRTEPAPGELASLGTAHWRARLRELYSVDRTPACRIIDATPGELRAWATYDLPSVRRWHRDRMVLIGDAAHAMSPSSGQGASMAIEDAVELGRCLRDVPEIDTAFAAFEGLRRSRVEQVVADGARSSNAKAAGPVARVLRDLFLPIFLKRQGDRAAAWLHGHHIDWDAPVVAGAGAGSR